jgi:hypothetical protein
MRALTGHEGTDQWAEWPLGGPGSPTCHPLIEIFLTLVSNLYLIMKSIFIHYET